MELVEQDKKIMLFRTSDGLLLRYRVPTPTIDRTIYMSDEDAEGNYRTASDIAPTKADMERVFISHNMFMNCRLMTDYLDREPLGISKEDEYTDRPGRYIRTMYAGSDSHIERALTDDEIATLKKIDDATRERYRKRLASYWKRYSDKVYISTYWANR